MAAEQLTSAGARRRASASAGLLLPACLALWLTPCAVGARQTPAHGPTRRASEGRQSDHAAREKIAEVLEVFGELLAASRNADAMGSHWQVRGQPWRDAQEAWERVAATLPPPVRGLKRCAVPLGAARGMIERADRLFRQSRDSSDTFEAARMLARHERLLERADVSLRRAERCYLAVRRLNITPALQD
jgi:hypothetical protein